MTCPTDAILIVKPGSVQLPADIGLEIVEHALWRLGCANDDMYVVRSHVGSEEKPSSMFRYFANSAKRDLASNLVKHIRRLLEAFALHP